MHNLPTSSLTYEGGSKEQQLHLTWCLVSATSVHGCFVDMGTSEFQEQPNSILFDALGFKSIKYRKSFENSYHLRNEVIFRKSIKMVAQARTRFYREFLTPALHRRFTRAAGVICFLCYIEAVLIGGTSSCKRSERCFHVMHADFWVDAVLWSWFPLGPAGIRTLLLFISSLLIFVLRVAQLHFGARITASPFETFRQYLFRVNTLQTLGFYLFSAWWFTEVYIWSSSDLANLRWVTEGK